MRYFMQNKFENQENYNCRITTDTGEEYLVYANWLHNERLDNWQGWHCEAGATRIAIDKNLEVWSGECHNDYLGSVLEDFVIFKHNSICKRDRCTGCTDDLILAKHKP